MNRITMNENPLPLGHYQDTHKEKVKEYIPSLLKQISETREAMHKKKLKEHEEDKLRIECLELQRKKEEMENNQKYKDNVKAVLEERHKYLDEKTKEKERKAQIKEEELKHMKNLEDEYARFIKKSNNKKREAKKEMAHQLKDQMLEKYIRTSHH